MLATTIERHLGKRVRVARLGSGMPVILLHGYPDNLQVWSELAPRLATQFEVIAFDWPGMGNSEAWPGGATPFDMAKRLLALVDAWGVEQAAVVGHDMGGQPALAFAAGHPKRVSHLVVMNSLVIWDEKTSWEINLLRRFGWNRVLLDRLPRAVFFRAIRTFLPRSYRLPQALRDDLWECFQQREVRHFVVRMCAATRGAFRHCSNRTRQSRLLPCFSGRGKINIFLSRMAGNWVRSYRKRKSKRFRKRSTGTSSECANFSFSRDFRCRVS